ncbi:MAG: hypothetical protein KDD73_13040 [Anaerolineales bacterium]|nr:hypothetical protein [Anaerolineales bacterium]MCB9128770.1 hypothetical protein [Ardenticatenales bacterium]
MGSIDFWGTVSAAFLLTFCVVGNLVFVALAFGMWKGAAWSRDHARSGLAFVMKWMLRGKAYVELGESHAVAPFVRLRGRAARMRTTVKRIRE